MINFVAHLEMLLKVRLAPCVLRTHIIACLLLKGSPFTVDIIIGGHGVIGCLVGFGDFLHGWLGGLAYSFPLQGLHGVTG